MDSSVTSLASLPELGAADLEQALDALVASQLDKLRTLLQGGHRETVTEEDAIDSLEEALERRAFARKFEADLNLDKATDCKVSMPPAPASESHGDIRLVSLPRKLNLTEARQRQHHVWVPAEGDKVAVYLSDDRPAWPGRVMDLEYFTEACLPEISRNQLFAVQVYGLSPPSTLSIHSHLLPLAWTSPPSSDSPPDLVEAYRLATSDESDPAAASVDDDVLASRSTYGQNPTRLDVNGLPWIQHLEWLQEQVKQEQPVTISYERRKEMQVAARQILAELSHEGVKSTPPLTTADIKQKHLESQTRASDEGLTMPPTRSQIKKARRKFQEVLDDPVLGPFMSKLDTSAVQSALVLPRRGTPRLGPSQLPDIVSGFTLGERRATMHAWTEAMKPKDFVSPLGLDVSKQDTIEVDHDMEAQADGWRVVSRRKRLRTHPVNDYSMAKSVSPGSHDGDVESKNIGGSSLEDIAEETA